MRECSHFVAFALLFSLPVVFGQQSDDVSIRPLKNGGLIVSIRDMPRMNYFEFQGSVNKPLEFGDSGDISISVMRQTNGFWLGRDDDVTLKVGDVIYYYIHVGIKGQRGYDNKKLSYVVRELFDTARPTQATTTAKTELEDRSKENDVTPPPPPSATTQSTPTSSCGKTITQVNTRSGLLKTICSGQIIFEDNFDTLSEDKWTIEQYIPQKPDFPSVSYQKMAVSVKDGMLRIEPRLQESVEGFDSIAIQTGTLDLSMGCTRPASCVHNSNGPNIIPPIISGRVTSNSAFAFKYGFIEIRAKVPQGDWLYPDIILETMSKAYGAEDNRVLRVAGARGNKSLMKGTDEYGNKVLYGGPMVETKCRTNHMVTKNGATEWGNDFHVYSVSWGPDMITLFVDGEEWGRVNLTPSSLAKVCEPMKASVQSQMMSFNDFFGLTLGVSAGGIFEFPDGSISGMTTSKPWKNTESRGKLKFYQASNIWHGTWTQPALLVDYVKVRAL